jgi:hypothetical protein
VQAMSKSLLVLFFRKELLPFQATEFTGYLPGQTLKRCSDRGGASKVTTN